MRDKKKKNMTFKKCFNSKWRKRKGDKRRRNVKNYLKTSIMSRN
jgi:hypothetical protein